MAGRSHPHSVQALLWLVAAWWLLLAGLPASAVVPPSCAPPAPRSEAACQEPEAVQVTVVVRLRIAVAVAVEGGLWFGGTDAVAIARYALVVPPQTTTFPHDGAGNRIGDAKHAYAWDPRGRMTTLSRNSSYAAVSGGPANATFVHDARGRRIGKTVQDTVVVGATTTNRTTATKWVYDGWLPVVEETQVDGGPIKRKFFVWGLDLSQTVGGAGGIGGLLAIHDPSAGKTYLPVTDGLGNIVAILDSVTKATLAKWTFDAWGNTVSSEGNTALCPFGWQSKYRDPESGLIYFGYRYYDPPTRRWLSRDPLGEAASFNPYSYCRENPLGFSDPVGAAVVNLNNERTLITSESDFLAPLFDGTGIGGGGGESASTILDFNTPDYATFTVNQHLTSSFQNPYDFVGGEMNAQMDEVLKQFVANYGKPAKQYNVSWYKKPFLAEYDTERKHKEALEALCGIYANYDSSNVTQFGFQLRTDMYLRTLGSTIPKERDNNVWLSNLSDLTLYMSIVPLPQTRGAGFIRGLGHQPPVLANMPQRGGVTATQPNRIYSARELIRRADEPGPFHNFPESFNAEIFQSGTKTVTPNFWRTAKPNMSNDSILYSLPGQVNGRAGVFEIGVRPSASGNTEVIMHRFFRPNP